MTKIKIDKRQPHHWAPVKEDRLRLLEITDKYVVPDRLSKEDYDILTAYRQELRDLTKQNPAATMIVWPTPPSFIKELNVD